MDQAPHATRRFALGSGRGGVVLHGIGILLSNICFPQHRDHSHDGDFIRDLESAEAAGDSFAVARVKSRSFSEKDIIAKVSLGKDPMQMNNQKRDFAHKIGTFKADLKKGSAYTDITGGVIQAAEFLNETGAGQKTILIFSDMQEELDYKTVRDFPIDLKGIRIIALNVTKLTTDNVDPRRYMGRLEWWEKRARDAGATDWRVVNDLEHLERIFKGRG